MNRLTNVIVIDGKLSSLLESYVRQAKEYKALSEFDDDALLFAILECGVKARQYNFSQWITYIYEKASLFQNGKDIIVKDVHVLDSEYECVIEIIVDTKSPHDLPF